ncbi:MAG: hypothetical protein ACFFCS_29560 [Candidatus Hodarchaeota archaeon]
MSGYKDNLNEINGLNQRGGRMLSIIDLLEKKTLNIDLAAYLLVAISEGASFLCCALKGGVGKTALMGALLGLVPSSEKIVSISSSRMIGELKQGSRDSSSLCYVVHEIGSGSWFGYLWGPPVLEYLSLEDEMTRVVSNIHADTYDQVMEQITSFGGSESDLEHFDLILFISLTGKKHGYERARVVNQVLETSRKEGKSHEVIYQHAGGKIRKEKEGRYSHLSSKLSLAYDFLTEMLENEIFHLDEIMPRLQKLHEEFRTLK